MQNFNNADVTEKRAQGQCSKNPKQYTKTQMSTGPYILTEAIGDETQVTTRCKWKQSSIGETNDGRADKYKGGKL